MNWVTGTVVYLLLWWLVFFMVLPIGVRPPHEVGEEPGAGHEHSAPVKPRMWFKVGLTTGISALLWVVAYMLIVSDLLSFRSG